MDHIAHPEEQMLHSNVIICEVYFIHASKYFQLLLHFVLNNQFHVFFLVNVDIETYLHKQVGTFDLFHLYCLFPLYCLFSFVFYTFFIVK